ncbi:hypothetical protein GCM10018962_54190 [Dactylosporangium matsuzakiense]|uniref:Secreted protein n=1 Tax=Dactylosporangium matsuzakiense TaxID=53360 RepID=A0A9W6KSD3_9ACTN|nr:hypothetical protein GCM10017581_073930 [Dactylosporangium matsuzakiense]
MKQVTGALPAWAAAGTSAAATAATTPATVMRIPFMWFPLVRARTPSPGSEDEGRSRRLQRRPNGRHDPIPDSRGA